ncbi:hypothetical protein BB560_006561 [Smittium megazygosporum]|uniref:sn-1-specific diacylglycerol lipase n=1 Tax=Smittium megazygosporum TaxID=133381 RepID=A0A2T9Y3W6_9FUNG|nr:hypothetical protein BB560_006561 [Smittium megazygosporum]
MESNIPNTFAWDSNDEDNPQRLWLKNYGIEAEEEFFELFTARNTRNGTVLNPSLARVISRLAKTGRISLRLLYLISSYFFDQVSLQTQANRDLVVSYSQKLRLSHLNNFANLFYANDLVFKPMLFVEQLVSKIFSFYRTGTEIGLSLAEESIRITESIFGDTETSVVFAECIKLFKREGWDKKIDTQAILRENGIVKSILIFLKTFLAWIILQLVTKGPGEVYDVTEIYCNFDKDTPFCFRSIPPSSSSSKQLPSLSKQQSMQLSSNPSSNNQDSLSLKSQTKGSKIGQLDLFPFGNDKNNSSISTKHFSKLENFFEVMQLADSDFNSLASDSDPPKQHKTLSTSDEEWREQLLLALNSLDSKLSELDSPPLSPPPAGSRESSTSSHRKYQSHKVLHSLDSNSNIKEKPNNISNSKNSHTIFDAPITTDAKNTAVLKKATTYSTNPTNPTDHASINIEPSLNTQFTSLNLYEFTVNPQVYQKNKTISNIDFVDFNQIHTFTTKTESAPPSLPSYSPKISNSPASSTPPTACHNLANQEVYLNPKIVLSTHEDLESEDALVDSQSDTLPPPLSIFENQQHLYPYKPLLFNIARFATFAFSAYGSKFLSVMQMDEPYIDIGALLKVYGDSPSKDGLFDELDSSYSDQTDNVSSCYTTDNYNSDSDFDQVVFEPSAPEPNLKKSYSYQNLSPLSPYSKSHKSPTKRSRSSESMIKPHNPLSKLQSFDSDTLQVHSPPLTKSLSVPKRVKSLGKLTPQNTKNSNKTSSSRLKKRRKHGKRRLGDHPNHVSFCKHTGISKFDLLFSSYVDPFPKKQNYDPTLPKEKQHNKEAKGSSSMGSRSSNGFMKQSDDQNKSGSKSLISAAFNWSLGITKSTVNYAASFIPHPFQLDSSNSILQQKMFAATENTKSKDSKEHRNNFAKHEYRKPKPLSNANSYFPNQEILYREPSIHAPVHFIAVDKATRSIVLAIRGTLGVSDFFIDMMCKYKHIVLKNHPQSRSIQFKVHSGMWDTACHLANPKGEVFLEICEALRRYPKYGLVLCGHSLGGGVAALLSLLWSKPAPPENSSFAYSDFEKIPPDTRHYPKTKFVTCSLFGLVLDRPVACYSYGSPCVVNIDLSKYMEPMITSVINSNDLFSTLSMGSVIDLLTVTTILEREKKTVEEIVLNAINVQKTSLLEKISLFGGNKSNNDDDLSSTDDGPSSNPNFSGDMNNANDSLDEDSDSFSYLGRQKKQNSGKSKKDHNDANSSENSLKPKGNRSKNSYQVIESDFGSYRSGINSLINTFNPVNYIPSFTKKYIQTLNPFSKNSSQHDQPDNYKTPSQTKNEKVPFKELKRSIRDLENWHLSVVKTLRASMDHEKQYPAGSVYILEQEEPDQSSLEYSYGSQGNLISKNLNSLSEFGGGLAHYIYPSFSKTSKKVKLLKCNDVHKRFSELRFSPNMLISHYPQVYDFNIGSLIHSCSETFS